MTHNSLLKKNFGITRFNDKSRPKKKRCNCDGETKRKGIEVGFFENSDEFDLAEMLAYKKFGRDGYDELNSIQKRKVEQMIKNARGKLGGLNRLRLRYL